MHAYVIVAIGLALSNAVGCGQARGACSATDYAQESLVLRARPSSTAKPVRSIPRENASTLEMVDAIGSRHRDWLKVKSGEAEGWISAHELSCRLSPDEAREVLAAQAVKVIQEVKARDMEALAKYVHPVKGVRFSPFATVDVKTDVVLTSSQLPEALRNPAPRTWGVDDGSGAPIRLTFDRYYRKFVYDRDFAMAPQVAFNSPTEAAEKAWEEYPNAVIVEYAFPEEGKTAAESLLLVFEQHRRQWYLAGIIHNGWTI